jgi:hypothetical protein
MKASIRQAEVPTRKTTFINEKAVRILGGFSCVFRVLALYQLCYNVLRYAFCFAANIDSHFFNG